MRRTSADARTGPTGTRQQAIWVSGFSDSSGSHMNQAEARFHNQFESQQPEENQLRIKRLGQSARQSAAGLESPKLPNEFDGTRRICGQRSASADQPGCGAQHWKIRGV
jgi:hypothetical protein